MRMRWVELTPYSFSATLEIYERGHRASQSRRCGQSRAWNGRSRQESPCFDSSLLRALFYFCRCLDHEQQPPLALCTIRVRLCVGPSRFRVVRSHSSGFPLICHGLSDSGTSIAKTYARGNGYSRAYCLPRILYLTDC